MPRLAQEPRSSRTELKLLDSLDRAVAQATARTGRFVAAHPRKLSAAVMLALGGFGVTAFGIAPMAPDAANLPKRTVTQIVVPDGIQSQLDALAETELQLYRTDLTRASDTADTLLRRLNVSDTEAAQFLRTDATARKLLEGRGGKMVRVQTGDNGVLNELVARYAPADPSRATTSFTRLTVRRVSGKFFSMLETAPLAAQIRMGSGTVRTSLFAATDDAHIPDTVATQLTDVFANDIDFRRQLLAGDSFSVLYEALTADGEPITWGPTNAGRLIAADFVNGGKTYSAVWFQDGNGKGAYYGFDGQSKKRAFLTSPVEFSRITSGFSMRMHPILNTWKQHKGVDFGAPMGTPIRAVGDGVVDFAGWQNGYGNVVEIRHSAMRSTLYGHMSRIDVRRGETVSQGEQIGAVGMTGWATGPHVHFEVKIDGEQQDPMLVAKNSESTTLTPAQRAQFLAQATSLKSQLAAADSMGKSGAYAE